MPLGKWRALGLEAAAALLLVLVLFSGFLVLLYLIFPSGTPLKELIQYSLEPRIVPGSKTVEATLVELTRDVRLRRGDSIAWGGARDGTQLFSQDAVQTFDRSAATIAFGARDRLVLGSNSLVVVTRLNAQADSGSSRSYRVQVEGELKGTLSSARRLQLEIAAAGHLAQVKRGGAARFAISRNDDNSASLAVYSGELRLAGLTELLVSANHGIVLRNGVPAGAVVPLAAPPGLLGPQPAEYRYRSLPPRVRLVWSGGPGLYHFQLAKAPGFGRPVVDQRLSDPEYLTTSLERGEYVWRVSRIEKGMEGSYSGTGRLLLRQSVQPPELSVEFPPVHGPAGPFVLTGRVAPGAKLFIEGKELAVKPSGAFSYQGVRQPGVNLIRVEALDPAGNASYASRIVYGRD